jgi:hypothetical protein
MNPNQHHTPNHPSLTGVAVPSSASDAPTRDTPLACDRDLRDALNDLVQENRLSVLRIEDQKCPMGVCLERQGLARWSRAQGPGRWRITQKGWLFLETRNTNAQETR